VSAAGESPRITSESRTADRHADGFGRKPCGAQKRPEKSDNLFKLPKGLAALKNRRQTLSRCPDSAAAAVTRFRFGEPFLPCTAAKI
jgi:hypothetical protein